MAAAGRGGGRRSAAAGLAVLWPLEATTPPRRRQPAPALEAEAMAAEVHTVADDEVVVFDGDDWTRIEGLEPDSQYTVLGQTFRTLPRPAGERLATFATVNDVHFGEVECGLIE